jgi:hypothetical protein
LVASEDRSNPRGEFGLDARVCLEPRESVGDLIDDDRRHGSTRKVSPVIAFVQRRRLLRRSRRNMLAYLDFLGGRR